MGSVKLLFGAIEIDIHSKKIGLLKQSSMLIDSIRVSHLL